MIPNKSRGYYFGSYDIAINKYSGADFSRYGFIFPGQGAAFPGMFKAQYLGFETIREKFAKANFLAQKNNLPKISDYILHPENIKKRDLPVIRNLALFTLEVALCEVLMSKKIIPQIITGHSFGEYAALVACGIISFAEIFDIVYHRDTLCPEANSRGFMLAVKADENKIKEILPKEKFYISNLNSYAQTVISVSPDNRDKIEKKLKANDINYKILSDVPQPYHSPYLNGVKDKIEEYLKNKKLNFKKPQIPLFSSVIPKLIDKDNFNEADIRHILINQITTPVNFILQISAIYSLRCFNFIELNEKRTFTAFVENVLAGKEIKTDFAANILEPEKKETTRYLSSENSKLFSLVSKVIGEITGYEIEKISFEDRYQEDLGIDSIKKADILLTVLDESKINPGEDFNTSEFGSIKDTVNYLKNIKKEKSPEEKTYPEEETFFERYVFAWEEKPPQDYFLLPEQKNKPFSFELTEIYTAREKLLEKLARFFAENKNQGRDIIIWAEYAEFEYVRIMEFFKFWKQWLKTAEIKKFNLVLASFGKKCPSADGYAAFFKSMKKELPEMFFKHIHFADEADRENMPEIIQKELREPLDVDVLYKNGKRFASVRKKAEKIKNKLEINEGLVILAVGGAKGITFSLLKNISKKYKPIIYLAGKSSPEDKIVEISIKELEKNNPHIYYESLDARDKNSLDKLLAKIKKKYGKVDWIINGAGTVDVSFIKDKTDAGAEQELSSKVLPALNILNLAKKYTVKKVINFSSVISKYGSAGQSIYALANETMNGFAAEFKGSSVIHWPPWDGVGMTRQKGIWKNLKEHGVPLLKPERADELFAADLVSGDARAVYYMDKNDDLFYGFSLNNFGSWEPLIGKLAEPFNISAQNSFFEKFFDLSKDVYLKDHQIKGISYAPAAFGMAMFFCLANIYNKKFPILENIFIHNPIIVKEKPLKCNLKIEKKDEIYDFSLKSSVLNFSCQVKSFQKEKTIQHAINKAEGEIRVDSIYSDYYFKDSLYLGPTFQNIDKAFLDRNENPFFRIDNSRLLPVLGLGFYDKLIQWIDAAFQTLSALGLKNNARLIPVKISKLTPFFQNKISNYLYVIPAATQFTAKGLKGDAVIVNENKEIILKMEGVFLKSIHQYGENKLEIVKYGEK